MREASLEDITRFLGCKRVAMVGVSRQPQHFSRALLKEFLANGYDAVPVNPHVTEIDGRKCYGSVAAIAPRVEAALLMTGGPAATDRAIQECHHTDIHNIWIYKSVNDGGGHERAVESCRLRGTAIVEGYCPLMFLPHPALFHRIHRFFQKVAGSYPL